MKKTILISGSVLIILLSAVLLFRSGVLRTDTTPPDYTIPRTIRYSYTIQNAGNNTVKQAVFKTYGPVKKTSFQICQNITASHPFKIKKDLLGNQVLIFSIDPIPPFGSTIITITAELLLSNTANRIEEANLEPWLNPETYIQSDHPGIKRTALSLKGADSNETGAKILNWVADYLVYNGYAKNPRGAIYAFTQKKGDCTEYMYLFTALTRATGIPSRGIGGYVVTGNTLLNPAGYHNWAEFYDKGKWQVADPQNRVFMKDGNTYIAMKIMKPPDASDIQFNRFHIEGEGLTAKMN